MSDSLPKVRWRRHMSVRLLRLKREWLGRRRPVSPDESLTISREAGALSIIATSVEVLYAREAQADLGGNMRRLRLQITHWRSPWPGWSGRPGHAPWLQGFGLQLPSGGEGLATLELTAFQPTPAIDLLRAALPALEPWRRLPVTLSPTIGVAGSPPMWLRAATVPNNERTDGAIDPHDLLLQQADAPAQAQALVWSRFGLRNREEQFEVLVDPATANPRDRQDASVGRPVQHLEITAEGDNWRWRITGHKRGSVIVSGLAGRALDRRQRESLLSVRAVQMGKRPVGLPLEAYANVVIQLAMTGVVVGDPGLPSGVPLAEELAFLIRSPVPSDAADPMEWEIRSVAQRRAAHRYHSPELSAALMRKPPSVSAILVTRRPHHAIRAVHALKTQTYPDLEIVLALHGCDARSVESIDPGDRSLEVVAYPAKMPFGAVLAAASELASGTLLTKVDDDDYYGPEHVWDLVVARIYTGATVVGKSAEFVHLAAHDTTVRRHMTSETYTDAVAGGTMLFSHGDLESLGGWRPVARSVDRGLLDRVLADGGLVYSTHALGFIYVRHSEGHTWDPGVEHFLVDARQKWVGLPPYAAFGSHGDPNAAA